MDSKKGFMVLIMALAFSLVFSTLALAEDSMPGDGVEDVSGSPESGLFAQMESNIEIYNDNGKIKAKYNIDGFQTKRRFVCYTEMNEDMITFYFYKYDKDDIHYTEDYKNGDMLFKFIKTNNKYFITNFKSPVDGKLINKKYELKKISNG